MNIIIPDGDKLGISSISFKTFKFLKRHTLVVSFIMAHTVFAIFLGRLYALAPDENGYLFTFNHLYGSTGYANPQYQSGWITAPKVFLWIAYLPAEILKIVGVPDYLSIRILSIALSALSLYLLKEILESSSSAVTSQKKLIF